MDVSAAVQRLMPFRLQCVQTAEDVAHLTLSAVLRKYKVRVYPGGLTVADGPGRLPTQCSENCRGSGWLVRLERKRRVDIRVLFDLPLPLPAGSNNVDSKSRYPGGEKRGRICSMSLSASRGRTSKRRKKTPSQVTCGRHVPRKIERPGSAPRLSLFQYFALEISHTRVPRQICGADAFIHRVRATHRVSRVPPCHGLGGGSGHGGIDFDSPGASPPRCATVSS